MAVTARILYSHQVFEAECVIDAPAWRHGREHMTSIKASRMQNPPPAKSKRCANADEKAAHRRSDGGSAFIPDPYDGAGAPARADEPLAESLAEEYVSAATAAEDVTGDLQDEVYPEEMGGPFTETSGQEEFATGSDASNPIDAERAPFPMATRAPYEK